MQAPAQTLIGRDAVLARLRETLEQTAAGRGSVVLLTGEAGVGKTALAEAASFMAEAQGITVTWGRAIVHAGAPPYWVLGEALGPLIEGEGGAELISSPALFDVVPEAQALRPDLSPLRMADPEAALFAAARATKQLLVRYARDRSLLIVLDDLQDADAATLRALALFVRDLRRTRVALVVTWRDVDAAARDAQRDALLALTRAGITLPIERLALEETATLLRRAADASDALVDRVFAATGGNPFFVTELARMLAASPSAPSHTLPLPPGVRELVRARVAALEPSRRRAVCAAAVLGLEAAQEEIVAMTGQPAPSDAGLLDVTGERARFTHGLVREAVYRTLDDAARNALHRRAADAIAATDRSSARNARLAYHLLRAGPGEIEAATAAALSAATEAVNRGGYDDARALLEEILAHLSASADPSRRLDVLIAAARAEYLSGHPDRGDALVEEAAALCRALGDAHRYAAIALVRGAAFRFGASDPGLIAWLEDALARLGEDTGALALRAKLLGRLAAARQPSDDPYATAEEGLRAIALARETGDEETLLVVLHSGMAAAFEYIAPGRRLPLNRECARIAFERGDMTIAWRATTRVMFDAFELGDLGEAERAMGTLNRIASSLGQDRFRYSVAMARAMRALFLGDLAAAEHARRDARTFSDGQGFAAIYEQLHALAIGRALRDIDAIRSVGAELVATFVNYGLVRDARYLGMFVAASAGDGEAVRAALGDGVERRFLQERPTALALAEVADALSEAQARTVYEWFLPHAGELAGGGPTRFSTEGPFDHCLALLASRLGAHDAAVGHLEQALSLLRRVGARPHLARTLADGARIHRARGGADDAQVARRLVTEARALAKELGAPGLIDHVERADGGEGPAGEHPAEALRLVLERVGDGWRLGFGGRRLELPHSVGFEMLDALVRRPGEEIHVLELMGLDTAAVTQSSGDVLDARARAEYKRRLEELGEEIEAAHGAGLVGRAAALDSERRWLVKEISSATGLGGRPRRAGSTAEKARVTVNRRLRRAIDRVRDLDADVASFLEATVRTGTYCSYNPLSISVVTG